LNSNVSRFEAALFDAEEAIVVGYYDGDDRDPRLNCEMECSLFEGEEDGFIGVGPCSFGKDPDTLLRY
jgi:hypothetical protein